MGSHWCLCPIGSSPNWVLKRTLCSCLLADLGHDTPKFSEFQKGFIWNHSKGWRKFTDSLGRPLLCCIWIYTQTPSFPKWCSAFSLVALLGFGDKQHGLPLRRMLVCGRTCVRSVHRLKHRLMLNLNLQTCRAQVRRLAPQMPNLVHSCAPICHLVTAWIQAHQYRSLLGGKDLRSVLICRGHAFVSTQVSWFPAVPQVLGGSGLPGGG